MRVNRLRLDLFCSATLVLVREVQHLYKYKGLRYIVTYTHINQNQSLLFFSFTPTLRSRSNVAFRRVL